MNFLKKLIGGLLMLMQREDMNRSRKQDLILLEGLALHFDDGLIRFNLACYACVMKNNRECLDFLNEAVKRDEKLSYWH